MVSELTTYNSSDYININAGSINYPNISAENLTN